MTLPAPVVRPTVVNDADAVSETNKVPGTASQAGSKATIVVLNRDAGCHSTTYTGVIPR